LVGACGCVAGLPCFPALESTRIHVLAPPKKRAEECDLFVRRGELMDETGTLLHRSHRLGPCGDDVIVRTTRSTDQSSASRISVRSDAIGKIGLSLPSMLQILQGTSLERGTLPAVLNASAGAR